MREYVGEMKREGGGGWGRVEGEGKGGEGGGMRGKRLVMRIEV